MYFDEKDVKEILLNAYGTLSDEATTLFLKIKDILYVSDNPIVACEQLDSLLHVDTCLDWYEWNSSIRAVSKMVSTWHIPKYMNRIDFIASVRHLAWCCYRMANGQDYNFVETEAQHASMVDGVNYVLSDPTASAESNHDNWMKYKQSIGWKWG